MSPKAFASLPAALSVSELGVKLGFTGYFAKAFVTSKRVQHVQCQGKARQKHHDASQEEHEKMEERGEPSTAIPSVNASPRLNTNSIQESISAENAGARTEEMVTGYTEIETALKRNIPRQEAREQLLNFLSSRRAGTTEPNTYRSHTENFEGYLWRTSPPRLMNAAPDLPIRLIPVWDGAVLKTKVVRGESLYDKYYNDDSTTVVPPIWLRDICPCEKCVHPETLQRMVDIFDLPKGAYSIRDCSIFGSDVYITWRDGHESCINFNELPKLSGLGNLHGRAGFKEAFVPFTNTIAQAPPTVQYEHVMTTEEGLASWLAKIRHRGIAFVEKVPIDPDATKSLLERIAYIRQTHYGGFWDFTADLSSKDTAYTQEALPLHTDTTYFSDPAGLQLFHLLSHTDGEGGETVLVDGFRAAHNMKYQDNSAYKILKNTSIYAHASGNIDSSIQPCKAYPVINEDQARRVMQIRWNPADRAGIGMAISEISEWYQAAKLWSDWIKHESNQYRFQLKPGTALIFDNWRVLHARTAFTGKRRMCGGYINRDDFVSRYKMTNWGRWQTLDALGLSPSLKLGDGNQDKGTD